MRNFRRLASLPVCRAHVLQPSGGTVVAMQRARTTCRKFDVRTGGGSSWLSISRNPSRQAP
ncbi:MAG: hypothetical protein OJF58_003195 [Enhydrobacter sp.]|nr:MAG: hypothetical protein OJF58_003195 [Enhydrobacter sp.]